MNPTLAQTIDSLMEYYGITMLGMAFIDKDGNKKIISRSPSKHETAHMMMEAAEELHGGPFLKVELN